MLPHHLQGQNVTCLVGKGRMVPTRYSWANFCALHWLWNQSPGILLEFSPRNERTVSLQLYVVEMNALSVVCAYAANGTSEYRVGHVQCLYGGGGLSLWQISQAMACIRWALGSTQVEPCH